MKCPRCELITSNNKDECPRCGLDLRPKKEGLHISPIAAEIQPHLNLPIVSESEEIIIPEINAEPVNSLRNSSNALESILALTNTIKDDVRSSSTNLQTLLELTENLGKKNPINIPDRIWKKCELEMVRLGLEHADQGFFEIQDLHKDKEIPLLFELAEREILDPNCIKTEQTPAKKAKIETELDGAFRAFEEAQDNAEALNKLNIIECNSFSLTSSDFISRASPLQRIACFAIDLSLTLIITTCFVWFKILPDNLSSNLLTFDKNIFFETLPYLSDCAFTFYLFWSLSQCLMLATWGSTIGGKILNTGVTDNDGFMLTFRHSLLRSLSWSVTILSCGLGVLTVFLKHKQTLHDRVSKTIVIKL